MGKRGFTLIEIAILIAIIGMISVGAVQLIGPVRDAQRAQTTGQRMNLIESAVQVYVIENGCLPCPANGALASDGAENSFGRSFAGGAVVATDCTAAACQTANAVVPWRTLGLTEAEATDAWGNRIRYAIAGTPCGTAVGLQDTNGMVACSLSNRPAGTINVNDLDVAGGPEMTAAAYVIVSSGRDRALAIKAGSGTTTGDTYGQSGGGGGQDENSDGDTLFANGSLNSTSGVNHFDDIVRFRTAPIIVQLCGNNACGNPI